MAFCCIFVPNFIVQAIVRSEPELRERAVAIVDGVPPVWSVAGMNEAAASAGIALEMTKSQAQQFLEVEIRHRSLAQEKAAHAALMDLGWSVSPRVEDTAPDTTVVDLAGLSSLLGPDKQIAEQLAKRALELGLDAQIAVASKIDASILAARGLSGITVIPTDKEAEVLGNLPVDVLCPSPEVLETLDRWGVRACKALAALPVVQLSERLGQEGVRLHELARGQSERAIVVAEPEIHFEEELKLEDAVEELEPLSFLLGRLLDQLCARLETRSLAACAVRMKFELDPGFENDSKSLDAVPSSKAGPKIYERVLSLPVAMRDSKMLLRLVRLHLQSNSPQAPIMKILLAAEAARPRVAQGGLFLPASPDPEKLELTVARLANLVGDAYVGSPELMDTHRPGEFHMRRFALAGGLKSKTNPEKETARPKTGFRVFRPAFRAKVDLRDGSPVRIAFQGRSGRVIAASGPWRSSGDWWKEDGWNNDEWDVEIEFSSAPGQQAPFAPETRAITASSSAQKGAVRLGADVILPERQATTKPQRGFYRMFFDAIRQTWFVRGAYD